MINIPLDEWFTWQKKLADFYFSNDMKELKNWTYQHGIFGMEPNLEARKEHAVSPVSSNEERSNKNYSRKDNSN